MSEPEHVGADGTVRKNHYGAGRQPWDEIVDLGWGPEFAAGNALKYVKRHAAKNGDDDLAKGRWYYARLVEMMKGTGSLPADKVLRTVAQSRSVFILQQLKKKITEAERALLRAPA